MKKLCTRSPGILSAALPGRQENKDGESVSLLIKNVLLNGKQTNIHIRENRIDEIGGKSCDADHMIDGSRLAALPGLVNTHTHAAMTLFRSYADDMPLLEWLQTKMWPLEAQLTSDDIYHGARMACLEMIKTGTTCFNDMYIHVDRTAEAVAEMGLRAVLAYGYVDLFTGEKAEAEKKGTEKTVASLQSMDNELITPAVGPHAIYTVSGESLEWLAEYARERDLLIHFHLAETLQENTDFIHKAGKRPVPFLDDIGFLGPDLVAAHGVHFEGKDIDLLAKHDVKISHNPVSNMKLAVGGMLDYAALTGPGAPGGGVNVSLGTDGCASNNNLDMFESMKFAALAQKAWYRNQTLLTAGETFRMATLKGAEALRIDAGVIEEGKLADIILVDLDHHSFAPNHNIIADSVYSVSGACVHTTICNGRVLMEDRQVPGEDVIVRDFIAATRDLLQRAGEKEREKE